MTKTIWIIAIAAAFVAGSIATGTIAYAGGDDDDDGGVLQTLLCPAGQALTGIVSGGGDDDDGGGIIDILCATDAVNDADSDPSNEDQTLSGTGEVVLSTTEAGDGGGTVTCADITGDASLCDGDDAVGDSFGSLQNYRVRGPTVVGFGGGEFSEALCDPNDLVSGGFGAFSPGGVSVLFGAGVGNDQQGIRQTAASGSIAQPTAICLDTAAPPH